MTARMDGTFEKLNVFHDPGDVSLKEGPSTGGWTGPASMG